MTSADLADALVTHFNALASKPIAFRAEAPDDPAEAVKEQSDWRIFVVPKEESETPIDRGDTCREEFRPSIIINGPIRSSLTRTKGLEVVKFLRDSLRETEFSGLDWDGNDIESLYDPEAEKKNQFLSLFRPTYYQFA